LGDGWDMFRGNLFSEMKEKYEIVIKKLSNLAKS